MDIQGSLILADGLLRLAHRLPSARHAWQLTGRLWTQHLVKEMQSKLPPFWLVMVLLGLPGTMSREYTVHARR
jgi:hypothetical protein